MDLPQIKLDEFLKYTSREEIIDWLQWNDPNGIYTDLESIQEFGNIMNKDEGVEIVKRQISSSEA